MAQPRVRKHIREGMLGATYMAGDWKELCTNI